MRRFVRKSKDQIVVDQRTSMKIDIVGGLPPGHPEQILRFTNDAGRRVVVRSGLPDLLEGEPLGQRWIGRGTSEARDDEYLVAPVAMAAEDESGAVK